MSFLLGHEENYRGVLLFGKGGETRYPFFLAVKNEEDTEQLARAALYYAEDAVLPNEAIRIRCECPATVDLLNKLGVEADIFDVVTLTAGTNVFDEMIG